MKRRKPLLTALATKYDREVAKLIRARRALCRAKDRLYRAEDRLCKIAMASAPIDASAPQHIRSQYEYMILASVRSEGDGPDYNALAPFTEFLTTEVIPALMNDASEPVSTLRVTGRTTTLSH